MPAYGPGDLDVLARAWDNALDHIPTDHEHDREEIKAIVLTGILDAARSGIRDEDELTESGLTALARYEDDVVDEVVSGL
jgi:hypothetical protein